MKRPAVAMVPASGTWWWMDPGRREVGSGERVVLALVGLLVVLTAGLASAETISDALTDGPARPDRQYDHSLFVWFYVSGTAAGLLGLLLLWWMAGRWRGRSNAAGGRHRDRCPRAGRGVLVLVHRFARSDR